ncbi:MAG: hypothetical protein A2580_04945 [Hydrogenophilales bacterium RIFOXYD1_FULL_62_11]|nr:MAG: hypothetical protein A2580_04945 [Hydrogenophilales bacterium RIFOXYD1_FULL_62_11]
MAANRIDNDEQLGNTGSGIGLKSWMTPFAFLLLGAALLITGCGHPEERGWNIPTDPQEKVAYDYAHSLKLPDSVPKPVPFNFTLARIKALWPSNPSVSDQYFEHLCKTEAGEYIFKTVENVEGVYQMRPRPAPGELDYDRHAPEEPTGLGWSGDIDDQHGYGVSETLVQPMGGEYFYTERPKPDGKGITRFKRGFNDSPPPGNQNGYQTAFHTPTGMQIFLTLPYMVVKEDDVVRRARYGYTWRGINRERSREFSIGAGEYLVVDLETNEVIAVKRGFKISGHDKNTPSHIWWGNARPCDTDVLRRKGLTPVIVPMTEIVRRTLIPVRGINDQYINSR